MLLDELEVRPLLTVAQLAALHRKHRADPNYARTVAEAVASGSPVLERAGGWLLRHEVAASGAFPPEDWQVVMEALPGVKSWHGRLLLCQLLSRHPFLMDVAPEEFGEFLRGCLDDPKPTVRAWSVSALHELARRHPAFRAEARRAMITAGKDSAKCVQARLRHLG